ncbi:MAG TPA: hypothetical protein VGF86_08280 [Candidatus Tumulicola sp.]|jgi:hypothetical protein
MLDERVILWLFGLALGGAIAVGVGKATIPEHGARKVVPILCAGAVALGLLLGWAINAYLDYVGASATLRL